MYLYQLQIGYKVIELLSLPIIFASLKMFISVTHNVEISPNDP